MVCVGGGALGAKLVRAGRQLAASLRAEWTAVFVETPEHLRLPELARAQVARTLKLAGDLGASTLILRGEDIAGELVRYSRAHHVTKIVVGKSRRSRWQELLRWPLADELIRQSGPMHILVITGESTTAPLSPVPADFRLLKLRSLILSLAAVAVVTLLGLLVRPFLAPTNIALGYLLAVVLSATSWGLAPAILSSLASVLTFDLLFVPPYGTLEVHDPQYFLTFAIFLIVGVITSELGSRVRAQAQVSRQRERQTAALYALSRAMTFAHENQPILSAAVEQIGQVLGAEALLLLPTSDGQIQPQPPRELDPPDWQAARWAFEHGQPAGAETSALSKSRFSYWPLRTAQGTLGVLGARHYNSQAFWTADQRQLLETFAGQIALALEHVKLSEQAEQARLLEASERFRNALLSSLSHDLRTPLASILGSVTSLLDDRAQLDEPTRKDLLLTAKEEATRLHRLLRNLLDMTRLESGALQPHSEWQSLEEVVGAALARMDTRDHAVSVQLAPHLPLVRFDSVLIEQVLVNLLDNALKFSPQKSPIEISAELEDSHLLVRVADRGAGIPRQDLERVFEKFYRVMGSKSVPGTGLGLSICKGIVQAHGGTIYAAPRAGGGAVIAFSLPAEKMGEAYELRNERLDR